MALNNCRRFQELYTRIPKRVFSTVQDINHTPREDQATFADSRLSQSTIVEAAYRDSNPAADEQRQQGGQVLPPHLLDACAARMEVYKGCCAFATETLDTAREQAAKSELRRLHGRASSVLGGIPLALKGNFANRNIQSTARRTRLVPGRYRVPFDATLVQRLMDAGVVIVGATAMDEFGIGARDMFTCPHAVLSPWRSTDKPEEARVAGGLSSATAVAVAGGMAYGALSSDLGGSLRVPAAYTGVVGLRPSPGRLSKAGLITFSARFDEPGVVTRSVADAALLTAALQGEDENDPDAVGACPRLDSLLGAMEDRPHDVANKLGQLMGLPVGNKPLQGLTIGVFKTEVAHMGEDIKSALEQSAEALCKAGASIKEVDLPDSPEELVKNMTAAFYRLATADGFATLADLDSILPDFSRHIPSVDDTTAEEEPPDNPRLEHVRDILKYLETFALESDAGRSNNEARKFQHRLSLWFGRHFSDDKVTAFLLPVTPGPSPTVEEAKQWPNDNKYALDAFNLPATLAGLPAITVPVALSGQGLPLGLQLMGPRLGEASLLAVAHVLEQAAAEGRTVGRGLLPLRDASQGSAADQV
eukprot:jgi/Botrbrau1/6726/Bobra.0324s0016.2